MVEGTNDMQQQLQEQLKQLVDDLSVRSPLINIRKQSYSCAAQCCSNATNSSAEDLERCVANCQRRLRTAEATLQSELQGFQNRLEVVRKNMFSLYTFILFSNH